MQRLSRLLSVLVGLGLALAGCSFIPGDSAPSGFQAAAFAPPNTWLYSAVTLRPSLGQLVHARTLANTFTRQPGWSAAVRWLQDTSTNGGIDLARDVLPLLDGDVATAVYSDEVTGFALAPSVLVLVHSPDPVRLVGLVASASGETPRPESDPRGATFFVRGRTTVGAAFKGWALFGDSRATLEDAVDRLQAGGKDGLSAQPRFQQMVGRLPSERVGFQYVDLVPILRSSLELASAAPRTDALDPSQAQELQDLLAQLDARVAASQTLHGNGVEIRVESASAGLSAEQMAQVHGLSRGDAADAFAHLPGDTLVGIGADLGGLPPELDPVVDGAIAEALRSVGRSDLAAPELHLSQWLGGQVAFGGTRGTLGAADGQPSLFLAAAVGDAAAARRDLDTLGRLFPAKSVVPVQVAGRAFTQGTAAPGQVLTYGIADGWLYATNGDASAALAAPETGGLTTNPRFAVLRERLGDDPLDSFADVEGLRLLGEEMLDAGSRPLYDGMVRPFVSPLRYFGGGSRTDPDGDGHGHFFLGIS